MYGCEKNWCFWTVVLKKTFESPLDCKEIQAIHPKENQSWIFIGRAVDEAKAPILWLPDLNRWLIGKDPDAGKDWRQEKTGMTEDQMVDGITASMDMSMRKLGSWWCIWKPDVQQSKGSQRVWHNWATELNWCIDYVMVFALSHSIFSYFLTVYST